MENLVSWYNTKCDEANFNRLGVMAFVLLIHTCIIIPATLISIGMNGNSTFQFALISIFSFGILVSLLGDMSAKIVIPVFILSTLVHLSIVVVNLL